jgi:hypothetical protein
LIVGQPKPLTESLAYARWRTLHDGAVFMNGLFIETPMARTKEFFTRYRLKAPL